MRWRDKYRFHERTKRPKPRKLTKEEQQDLLEQMTAEVRRSPVLMALGCRIKAARGRFYVDRVSEIGEEQWGRITPLDGSQKYLLERQRGRNQWYLVAEGGPQKIIKAIAGDTQGTFHGLGSLDAALHQAGDDPSQLEIGADPSHDKENQCPSFTYRASGAACSAQEALHLYFHIPLDVLTQPRGWYMRHRRPIIVEFTPDRSRVLVKFYSSSMSGDPIIGACLYLRRDSPPPKSNSTTAARTWGAYTIRPSASESITMAEAWIVKRSWRPW